MTTAELAARLTEILGYRAAPEYQATFDVLHRQVYGIDGRLRREQQLAEGTCRDQYLIFVQCCVSAVPKAFRASLLHHETVATLERTADRAIREMWNEETMANHIVGIGDTVRFDAAYHAFLFSYRSCLDYFDRGMRGYFADETNPRPTFANYPTLLEQTAREPIDALRTAFEHHRQGLQFAYGAGAQRNQAAHNEFLKPAHVSAFRGALRLTGGSEEADMVAGSSVADVLSRRISTLNSFLRASFAAIAGVDWP